MTLPPLINVDEAISLHGKQDIIFAEVGFHLPALMGDARAGFFDQRIKSAVWFDMDAIADTTNPLPHTMPDADTFTAHMRRLGVNQNSLVIVYDRSPIYSSARAWYMLRLFGHKNVRVLNGGMKAWLQAGGATEAGDISDALDGDFIATAPIAGESVISLEGMKDAVDSCVSESAEVQIVDARPVERFSGTIPEPRAGLRSGHIPGTMNIPVTTLFDPESLLFHDEETLKAIFATLDLDKPIITTCGSGVTACGLALGLAVIGRYEVRLYDGSWTEWGSRDDCPILP